MRRDLLFTAAAFGLYGSVKRDSLSTDDDRRTAQVISAMWGMVDATDQSQAVYNVAKRLGWTKGRKDYRQQLLNVFEYLRSDLFRFRRDTWRREVVGDPEQLIDAVEKPGGRVSVDCDDIATIGAALVRAMGFKPIFITTARDPSLPWGHVFFGVVADDGSDIPMDPQESPAPFLWTRRPGVDKVGVWDYHASNPNRPRTPRIVL